MASSKSNDSTNSGLQDASSDTNDDDKDELCPGFKDVEAFVKVSERATPGAQFCVQASSHFGNVDVIVATSFSWLMVTLKVGYWKVTCQAIC